MIGIMRARTAGPGRSVAFSALAAVEMLTDVRIARASRAGRTVAFRRRELAVSSNLGRWTSNDVFSCAFGRR